MHIHPLSTRAYIAEAYRPWKLFTFIIGMVFLFYGALNFEISDWDVGISIIMGSLTYICAPWTVRTILHGLLNRPRYWLLWIVVALVVSWVAVDGVYVLYHTAVGNTMLRRDNFFISFPSYLILGFLWLYAGSLRELLTNVLAIWREIRNQSRGDFDAEETLRLHTRTDSQEQEKAREKDIRSMRGSLPGLKTTVDREEEDRL